MKKNYKELIQTLCDFHAVALLDRKWNDNTKGWIITLNKVCQMLYHVDYIGFLNKFPVNKPVIMPGTLEAHYNLINALIYHTSTLRIINFQDEIYLCANDVKYVFDDFLYQNKFKVYRSRGFDEAGYSWWNIYPFI